MASSLKVRAFAPSPYRVFVHGAEIFHQLILFAKQALSAPVRLNDEAASRLECTELLQSEFHARVHIVTGNLGHPLKRTVSMSRIWTVMHKCPIPPR